MKHYAVARLAADPPIGEQSSAPGGWNGLTYFRLHGSPRRYWSRYDAGYLSRLALVVRPISQSADVWCVFDNTASGSAFENAGADPIAEQATAKTNVLPRRIDRPTRSAAVQETSALRSTPYRALSSFIERIVIPPGNGPLQVLGNLGEMLTAAAGRTGAAAVAYVGCRGMQPAVLAAVACGELTPYDFGARYHSQVVRRLRRSGIH